MAGGNDVTGSRCIDFHATKWPGRPRPAEGVQTLVAGDRKLRRGQGRRGVALQLSLMRCRGREVNRVAAERLSCQSELDDVTAANYAQWISLCVVFGERPVGHGSHTPNYAHRIAMCVIWTPTWPSARASAPSRAAPTPCRFRGWGQKRGAFLLAWRRELCGRHAASPTAPPLAPGSLPLAAVGEFPGMTVRNAREFASRGGACECYLYYV